MTKVEKRLLIYISSLPSAAEARFETERQAAMKQALTCGLVWPNDSADYDWDLVRRHIEEADAFILLCGREYGPVTPTGLSLQHRELVHAQSLNKPVYVLIENAAATGATPDQLKLEDFRRQLMAQVPHKVWHLGDELSVHVKATIQGWQRKGLGSLAAESAALQPGEVTLPESFRLMPEPPVVSPVKRVRGGPAREAITLTVQANVYRGGTLTRHLVKINSRTDRIWRDLEPLLRLGSSEVRLRSIVEQSVTSEASRLLLEEHKGSHAVDDVRIERNQFRQLLSRWARDGLVTDQRDGARTRWSLKGV